MPTHFEQELAGLKEKLLTMAGYAERAVSQAVHSIVSRDEKLAREVKQGDDVMDQYEVEIDDLAIKLLAKAPLASDLRLITVAMKISQNLERIGDEATTIARRSIKLNRELPLAVHFDIPRMAALVVGQLKDSLDSFVNKDPNKAKAVIPRDEEVDEINHQFNRELSSYMMEHPDTITRCLHLMVVSKSLERIADHATNIAEEAVYLYEARDIRHGGGDPAGE